MDLIRNPDMDLSPAEIRSFSCSGTLIWSGSMDLYWSGSSSDGAWDPDSNHDRAPNCQVSVLNKDRIDFFYSEKGFNFHLGKNFFFAVSQQFPNFLLKLIGLRIVKTYLKSTFINIFTGFRRKQKNRVTRIIHNDTIYKQD